ncbi:hypothetical protein [Pseudomonas yamanorum]|uniref:hypothetical protein n=1 Tax=Pseudomonas yamanorum TaxID=515393 RepID=UPI002ED1B95D|nr:hypothetical protein VYI69_14520 [Pseudomonas yamanorum]
MLSFSSRIIDANWGCTYQEVVESLGGIDVKVCYVEVENVNTFAEQLAGWVLDTSWMADLDKGTRRQYDYTVKETSDILVEVFRSAAGSGKIGEEFGELMVSIGSARGLEQVFHHAKVPIAELWKPQALQNEGFDFHTVCTDEFVNFGEAKFSSSKNPHGPALDQVSRFISEQKHLRDRGHLLNLVGANSIAHLDDDRFGVVAAFSINSLSPLVVFQNALKTGLEFVGGKAVKVLYLVGVGEA